MPSTKRTGAMLPDGLTRYSDLAVMLPAAGVIAVWLLAGRSPRALLAWLVTLGACYLPVALSKLAFKGWGFGIRALDLTVISGQAMNATLMLVVLASLLARQIRPAWRWPAALAALAVAWWYGLLQIAAATHPVSEAVAGCLLGTAGALLFLRRLEGLALRRIPAGVLLLGLLAIGAATEAPRLPVEVWLDRLATALSGRPAAFAPRAWRD